MDGKKELDALCLWPTKAGFGGRTDGISITPHKITVVFLVQEFVSMKLAVFKDQPCPPKYRRQFAMLLLRLIQYPDLTYRELHALLCTSAFALHPAHMQSFEKMIDILSTQGIQVLFELQKFIESLITETTLVNHFGILGHYVRRIVLVLDKLTFSEMMELYKHIKLYYDLGRRAIAIERQQQQQQQTQQQQQQQSMLLLHQQSNLNATGMDMSGVNMTAGCSGGGETAGGVGGITAIDETLELHAKLAGIDCSRSAALASQQQCCWSIKQADLFVAQQCNLLENNEPRALPPIELHAKLDKITADNPLYAQAHILSYMNSLRVRDFLGAMDAFHRAFDRSAVRANAPPETKGFQYSSLNLAIMHAQFGHTAEALVSLRECVMLAQECGDRVCLQLAQSWLCLLDRNYVQLCERSVASQTELSLVHSVSLGVQFIVNVAAVSGFRPSRLFELLMKSEVINFQHSLMDLMANCIAQKAAVWTLYGKNEVASLCSQLLLHVVRTHNTRESDSMENGEGVCHSLCCTAMWLALRGDYHLSAVVLQHARERFPRDPIARTWMLCDAYVSSEQAMHRCRWDDAAQACSQLYALDRTVSLLQRATLQVRRGDAPGAERIVRRLLDDELLEPLHRCRAWMVLAHCRSADMAAVNVLTDAAVYARTMYLAYEEAMIDVHLAQLLLAMRMPRQALRTLRRCMNTVLADGGLYDTARMLLLFVRCLVGAEEERMARVKRLDECAGIVADVLEKFRKLDATAKVKDVYVWLAQANDAVGRPEERNRWARKLRELDQWSPTPPEYANVFY